MRGLRLTWVRGVPQCDGEEVEALFRLQCEGAARKKRTDSFTWAHPILITVPITSALAN
jgi:hypothetical protein